MAETGDLRNLVSRQHSRIDALEKQFGVRPAEAEDVDLPAAEYARNFYITILHYHRGVCLRLRFPRHLCVLLGW